MLRPGVTASFNPRRTRTYAAHARENPGFGPCVVYVLVHDVFLPVRRVPPRARRLPSLASCTSPCAASSFPRVVYVLVHGVSLPVRRVRPRARRLPSSASCTSPCTASPFPCVVYVLVHGLVLLTAILIDPASQEHLNTHPSQPVPLSRQPKWSQPNKRSPLLRGAG